MSTYPLVVKGQALGAEWHVGQWEGKAGSREAALLERHGCSAAALTPRAPSGPESTAGILLQGYLSPGGPHATGAATLLADGPTLPLSSTDSPEAPSSGV